MVHTCRNRPASQRRRILSALDRIGQEPVGALSRTARNVRYTDSAVTRTDRNSPIPVDQSRLSALCRRYYVARLAFFGSVLRDDFGPESDLDVLVEFLPGHTPGFAFFELQDQLSEMFGRPVDLHTPKFLSRYFRGRVLREARDQFVAA